MFIKIVLIICSSVIILFSQSEIPGYEVLKQRYNIIQGNQDIFKLNSIYGAESFTRKINLNTLPPEFVPDLVIDLRTIDTSQYCNLFNLWSEIPIATTHSSVPLIIEDANYDNRKEVYGMFINYNYSTSTSYVIYEINKNGTYDSVYKYPDSSGYFRNLTDLENDGIYEIINSTYSDSLLWHMKVLTGDPAPGYPVSTKLVYDPSSNSGNPVDINFYDMDGDDYNEMIYFLNSYGDSLLLDNSFQICKYDKENNKFEQVFQHQPPYHTKGFAFGDFDLDGKQNFLASDIDGEVFVYEYVDGNTYNFLRVDSLPILNVYLHLFTDDLDKNGKPEFWVGGTGKVNGVSGVILFVYESDNNDSYKIVYNIAVLGIFPFFGFNILSNDIDNDGTDEVILCLDQHVLILKNNLKDYELYYLKRNELLNQNSVYYSVTAEDLDGDKYPEILISMDFIENHLLKIFSRIYKKSGTIGLTELPPEPASGYFLSESYPNPFNSSTTIKYFLKEENKVTINIYNVLGRNIKSLVNNNHRGGEYEAVWDGTDESGIIVSSGIYFINMVSGNFNKSIKTVLLK